MAARSGGRALAVCAGRAGAAYGRGRPGGRSAAGARAAVLRRGERRPPDVPGAAEFGGRALVFGDDRSAGHRLRPRLAARALAGPPPHRRAGGAGGVSLQGVGVRPAAAVGVVLALRARADFGRFRREASLARARWRDRAPAGPPCRRLPRPQGGPAWMGGQRRSAGRPRRDAAADLRWLRPDLYRRGGLPAAARFRGRHDDPGADRVRARAAGQGQGRARGGRPPALHRSRSPSSRPRLCSRLAGRSARGTTTCRRSGSAGRSPRRWRGSVSDRPRGSR